ncbi:hypothetical protein HBI24_122510 [Parastagonospora nodorum]|nr:hypothetical protein HBH53_030800 [Parastagonospora nodorum]KAH4059527.1 hypothetical protein HBH49_019260 [Parastagonospora nodorum]KAH4121086.1 hypothetical protein HBH47_106880 [Parastagonospora nodorum]KAH4819860.1 hypothetical protein HBH61_029700 [Parastagonospora nodorum]KAH4931601.1 hypothetical protein HBH74_094480 [Parastagonospora nodorum]
MLQSRSAPLMQGHYTTSASNPPRREPSFRFFVLLCLFVLDSGTDITGACQAHFSVLNYLRVLKHATCRLHVEASRPDTIPLQFRDTQRFLSTLVFASVRFTSPSFPHFSRTFALEKSLPSQILQLAWASHSLGRVQSGELAMWGAELPYR